MTPYVDRDDVLVELGIDPETATNMQKLLVDRKITAAQAKVLLFLGRDSFEPRVEVVRGLWWNTAYPADHEDPRLPWPDAPLFDDRTRYAAHAPNADEPDLFDVSFKVGLDLAEDPALEPIKEYLIAEAAEMCHASGTFPGLERRVSSVSAEGQSLSYEKRPASADQAGGTLSIATLARFKRFGVGRPANHPIVPFPYTGSVRV